MLIQEVVVKSRDILVADRARRRVLPLRITYDQSGALSPVIVFSHGAGGSGRMYDYLVRSWASQGFICIQPTHDDSIEWNARRKERRSFVKTLRELPTNVAAWTNRVEDIRFIIDLLPRLPVRIRALTGRIDQTRIGLSGHSLGAFTVLLTAGVCPPFPAEKQDLPSLVGDKRVKGIIAVSPQGLKERSNTLAFDKYTDFDQLTLPVFYLTGDRDISIWNTVEQRQQAFNFSPPGDKFYVSINGANHMTFVGETAFDSPMRPGFGQSLWGSSGDAISPFFAATGDQQEQLRLIERSTSLFWLAYLKGDQSRVALLKDGELRRLLGDDGLFLQK